MHHPPLDPERVAEETARRLLERATALESEGPTLAQLREAAAEAGISNAAFDAAVAEWRADLAHPAQPTTPRRWPEKVLRNLAAVVVGWSSVTALAVAQQLVDAPWLVHKLTDPVGMAIGALVAARLRARTATVLLGGLAVSQGAEFLMDLFSGAPSIHGFGAHMALMIAGVAGVAVGRFFWGRRSGPEDDGHDARESTRRAAPNASSDLQSVDSASSQPDTRFMELLRLRRRSYATGLQPG